MFLFPGILCLVVSAMFSWMISNFIVLCMSVPDACSTVSVPIMTAVASVEVERSGLLRYQPSYAVDEYILRYVSRLHTYRLEIVSIGKAMTVIVGNEEDVKA